MIEFKFVMVVVWFIVTLLILRFTPNDKIKEIGNFYKKVLSILPLSKIFEIFKK